jgi:type I restriction enzyme S subunit
VTAQTQWPTVQLGEVLTPVSREETVDAARAYPLLGVRLDGRGPFLRETVSGTETAAKHFSRVAKGDFIYSRLFAWRGAFGVIPEELDGAYVSDEFPTFAATPDCLDSEFLRYWFRLPSTLARVTADCTGSTPLTRNRFKEHFFLALEIPLPPLAEQQRIVARIEELAALIAQARALRQIASSEAKALLASALDIACSGKRSPDSEGETARQMLERVSSMKWPEHVEARKRRPTALPPPPEVPETWLIAEAGELQQYGAILDIQDGNHGSDYPRRAEFGDEGVPFVTAKQLENGAVHIAEAPRLPKDRSSRLRTGFARAGDVLLTHNASVGEVAVAPADAGDFLLGTSVTYWRCNPEALAPRYLFYFMRSGHFQDQLRFIMKQTTRNQVSVLKQVNLWICLPPLREQRRIAAELDVLQAEVDTARRLQNEAAAELDALLPSILDRAFKGGL